MRFLVHSQYSKLKSSFLQSLLHFIFILMTSMTIMTPKHTSEVGSATEELLFCSKTCCCIIDFIGFRIYIDQGFILELKINELLVDLLPCAYAHVSKFL